MNTVPEMISTKDLAYLEDIFNWNLTAAKKASHYMKEIQDKNLANLASKVHDLHANICKKIVSIIS